MPTRANGGESLRVLMTAAALLLGYAVPQAVQAQIYAKGEGTDGAGAIILTDIPQDHSYRVVVAAPTASGRAGAPRAVSPLPSMATPPLPSQLRGVVQAASRANAIDPALVQAVMGVESAYKVNAVSPKGALGVMQLMPGTAARFGVRDVFNPQDNIYGGARYLRYLLNLFGNDLELALAAYNAGENAVIRAGYRVPNYPETKAYVPKVLSLYHQFKG